MLRRYAQILQGFIDTLDQSGVTIFSQFEGFLHIGNCLIILAHNSKSNTAIVIGIRAIRRQFDHLCEVSKRLLRLSASA